MIRSTTNSKVVIVTGAARGLGRAIAESAARRGHHVFATLRDVEGRNRRSAESLRALAGREGLSLGVVELDVADDDSVEGAIEAVRSRAGRIDVVVNNAALTGIGHLESFDSAQFRAIFEVNVLGAQRTTRAALPALRESRDGLLVYVSSGLGRFVSTPYGLYAATKHALEALAETYRYELAPQGIDVAIVEPGEYRTTMLDRGMIPADPARSQHYGPLAEMPEKIRSAAAGQAETPAESAEVGEAVADLIDARPGTRPLRNLIGADAQGLVRLNETTARFQEKLLKASGLAVCLARAAAED